MRSVNTLAVSVFLCLLCLIPQRRPKRAAGGPFSAPSYPLLSLKTPILCPSVCVYVYMQVYVCLFGSARLLSVLPLIRLNMPGSRSTRAEARVYFQVSGKAANVGRDSSTRQCGKGNDATLGAGALERAPERLPNSTVSGTWDPSSPNATDPTAHAALLGTGIVFA